MILSYVSQLNESARIVLASGSARRKQLLQVIGLDAFEVHVSTFEEDLEKESFPSASQYCLATARIKGERVLEELIAAPTSDKGAVDLLIAADTVVVAAPPDGMTSSVSTTVIEKAKDAEEAKALLLRLSGKSHTVFTCVILFARDGRSKAAPLASEYSRRELIVETTVHMSALSPAALEAYLKQPAAWQGKAGAYGIQDVASCFIKGIEGDYCNVMGLPVQRVSEAIVDFIESGFIISSKSDTTE